MSLLFTDVTLCHKNLMSTDYITLGYWWVMPDTAMVSNEINSTSTLVVI